MLLEAVDVLDNDFHDARRLSRRNGGANKAQRVRMVKITSLALRGHVCGLMAYIPGACSSAWQAGFFGHMYCYALSVTWLLQLG